MQLAEWCALLPCAVGGASRFDGLRAKIDHHGIDRGVGGVHTFDMRLHYLLGRYTPIANRVCGINGGPLPDR